MFVFELVEVVVAVVVVAVTLLEVAVIVVVVVVQVILVPMVVVVVVLLPNINKYWNIPVFVHLKISQTIYARNMIWRTESF